MNSKKVQRVALSMLASAITIALASCGEGSKEKVLSPEELQLADIVKSRQAGFQDIGASFKAISDEMKAGRLDSATVDFSIRNLNTYAQNVHNWFPEGSGPELGVKTEASAKIWEKPEEFAEAVSNFEAAISTLSAEKADTNKLGANFARAGGTCKSCHDVFRLED